jgi:hypothetical protein
MVGRNIQNISVLSNYDNCVRQTAILRMNKFLGIFLEALVSRQRVDAEGLLLYYLKWEYIL